MHLCFYKKRTGTITKEEALKRFHEYYNEKYNKPISRLRAKMFDMMYEKKLMCDNIFKKSD